MNHPLNTFMRYMLFVLHALLGINAAAGGFLMMIKPDGSLLQMHSGLLTHHPLAIFSCRVCCFLPASVCYPC
jgi:hypothetical protein